MKNTCLIIFVLLSFSVNGQKNLLGKSEEFIKNYFSDDPTFYLKIDSLTPENILLTFKSLYQYPYYTYEIDLMTDICVSYGVVSKNQDVLGTYLSLLNFAGTIVLRDSANYGFRFELKKGNTIRYYDIKQPYREDENVHRKNLFYILVREKRINVGDF